VYVCGCIGVKLGILIRDGNRRDVDLEFALRMICKLKNLRLGYGHTGYSQPEIKSSSVVSG